MFLELVAAIAGTWYVRKAEQSSLSLKLLVNFLWLNILVEILASYTSIAYFSNYEYFGFVEETRFRKNYWLYNIRNIIEFIIYSFFFLSQLKASKFKKIWKILCITLVPAMVLNLFLSDVYFQSYSQFTSLSSAFIYMILIFRYFFEMLQSDKILDFYRTFPFYISIGVLLWYLTITPFLIYSKFYEAPNMEFVKIQRLILVIMNVFMYSMIIIGFYIDYRYGKKEEAILNSVRGGHSLNRDRNS